MPRYRKLVKHRRDTRDDTKSFSKNSKKEVYRYGDGSTVRQSHLNGEYQRYNRDGRPVGKPYGRRSLNL